MTEESQNSEPTFPSDFQLPPMLDKIGIRVMSSPDLETLEEVDRQAQIRAEEDQKVYDEYRKKHKQKMREKLNNQNNNE
jgi:hypothetical protein